MLDIIYGRPTIRHAIMKRIAKEPGVAVADLKMIRKKDHLQVGVWLILTDCMSEVGIIDVRSFFDLPKTFEHSHLLNEIDEIAESVKKARLEATLSIIRSEPKKHRETLPGTGLRGRWPKDKAAAPAVLLAKEAV